MIQDAETDVAKIGIRLLDDAYLAWFSAESESERALRDWFEGTGAGAGGYHRYRAALDREEAAAGDLQRLWALSDAWPKVLVPGTESVCE